MPIANLTPLLLLAAGITTALSALLVHANAATDPVRGSPAGQPSAATHRCIANALLGLALVMFVATGFSWYGINAAKWPLPLPRHFDAGGIVAVAIIASAIAAARKKIRARSGHDAP